MAETITKVKKFLVCLQVSTIIPLGEDQQLDKIIWGKIEITDVEVFPSFRRGDDIEIYCKSDTDE